MAAPRRNGRSKASRASFMAEILRKTTASETGSEREKDQRTIQKDKKNK